MPIEYVQIPAGSFVMGSCNELFGETPAHTVRIQKHFLLSKQLITRSQWIEVMGNDPSEAGDTLNCPVDSVSWDQAQEFCRRLSDRLGHTARLPSEAEWEYACRAGTGGEYFFGTWGPHLDDSEVPLAAQRALCGYAWFDLNSRSRTHPVGLLRPNPWGLHDMLGHLWEWCADVWHDDYVGAPSDGSAWVSNAGAKPRRCLRGGAWDMNAFRCRSPYRSHAHPSLGTSRFGLRLARDE